jgi:hypothetical protein
MMSMKYLDDILEQIWPAVRERHLFPELPAPQISEGKERVGLEIKGKRISLSSLFVNEMSHRLDVRLVVEGLLDHAVSHYVYCPWDFSTHLMLYKEARSILPDKKMAEKAADTFMDVVADTHCVSRGKTPLPAIYRHIPKSRLDEAICALYQKIWGLDVGAEGFEELATKLSRIPYLASRRWPASIRRFASLILEVLEAEETDGSIERPSSMGDHDLNQYPPQEIEKGLKSLASSAATPAEFKAIYQDFKTDISHALAKNGQAIGLGKGDSFDADILYYMKLAQNYALPVRKRLMEKSGSLYPHHHVPWEAGKPFYDIDPWKSFGKIMPGLAKSWHRIEWEVYGQDYGTPDCVVIIDSSASMIEPRKHLSHAVLGAACAAESYLRNGANVAVYNFSDASAGDEHILFYTRNRRKIYGAICRYFGGGTQLFVKTIQTFQAEPPPDIFLITDMQIINLDNLVRYFNECRNRITAVLVGENKHVNAFRQRMALNQNVQIYGVENRQDITEVVLGKVRENLKR